ncbi:MAG: HEAT repeat domain-containing protein [Candidatus Eisenbacteria bacterium]|uniref:HEAT repeat domain-containing protein n=1 Tax=Eiseniibacteriota bacterium TaxID=2212470 RepID=A0A956RNZ5_UNCEI|nr:HEAT repeat domain-containing protein [Candidatus Eisenbacteria bacterium]
MSDTSQHAGARPVGPLGLPRWSPFLRTGATVLRTGTTVLLFASLVSPLAGPAQATRLVRESIGCYMERDRTLGERVNRAASLFSGVVVAEEWPWGREGMSVRPGEPVLPTAAQLAAAAHAGSLGIVFRLPVVQTEAETTVWSIDRHLVTLAATARWKGEPRDTVQLVTRVQLRPGDHWLVFTGTPNAELDDPSIGAFESFNLYHSVPIELASYELWRLPEPVWQHPTLSPWPLQLEDLAARVRADDPSTVIDAAKALGRLQAHEDEAARVLGDLLMTAPADSVLDAIYWGIGDVGEPILPFLGAAMQHADERVRRAALEGLQRLGRRALPGLPLVRDGLADPDSLVREKAAELCYEWELDAVPAYEALLVACADPDPTVRLFCTDALAIMGPIDPRSRGMLLHLMDDPSFLVRMHAGNGLGMFGVDDPGVRTRLTAGLEDENEWVRKEAAHGLRRLDNGWREEYERKRDAKREQPEVDRRPLYPPVR